MKKNKSKRGLRFPDLPSVLKSYPFTTKQLAVKADVSRQYINRLTAGGIIKIASESGKRYSYSKEPVLIEDEHYFLFVGYHYYNKKALTLIKELRKNNGRKS